MMPTTTSGIAHGMIASARASQRSRSGRWSSKARPRARKNCGTVTPKAQTSPIRKESQKRVSWNRSEKFSSPTKRVAWVRPDWASVKASPMP